ncbi:predicted protein [Sclerotinia sclerotiorum 1980 UF-70]|uniref:Uncharacterized protein n=1 Tax=Sclerotinia sclerotiorum (strain ATCC 18683 / 1980 / Ss-1) TaxID=665079 RepID=A7F7C7_SCLS1|nr:predicted protein [Sclerotinia sclerotiorum 1980 UF-70]EDN98648.1 predicted protein [Sclerotinia sclerotiorum 1980 UF-70]
MARGGDEVDLEMFECGISLKEELEDLQSIEYMARYCGLPRSKELGTGTET